MAKMERERGPARGQCESLGSGIRINCASIRSSFRDSRKKYFISFTFSHLQKSGIIVFMSYVLIEYIYIS